MFLLAYLVMTVQDWAGRFHCDGKLRARYSSEHFLLAHRVNHWASVGASVQVISGKLSWVCCGFKLLTA